MPHGPDLRGEASLTPGAHNNGRCAYPRPMLGINLNGSYVSIFDTSVVLPAISTLKRTSLQLEFRRWLGIANTQSGHPSSPVFLVRRLDPDLALSAHSSAHGRHPQRTRSSPQHRKDRGLNVHCGNRRRHLLGLWSDGMISWISHPQRDLVRRNRRSKRGGCRPWTAPQSAV